MTISGETSSQSLHLDLLSSLYIQPKSVSITPLKQTIFCACINLCPTINYTFAQHQGNRNRNTSFGGSVVITFFVVDLMRHFYHPAKGKASAPSTRRNSGRSIPDASA